MLRFLRLRTIQKLASAHNHCPNNRRPQIAITTSTSARAFLQSVADSSRADETAGLSKQRLVRIRLTAPINSITTNSRLRSSYPSQGHTLDRFYRGWNSAELLITRRAARECDRMGQTERFLHLVAVIRFISHP